MPRDANGNYTLPSGNPVVSGTTVESAWSNTTMDDLRQAMTDSLDRFGRGGMQAPFRFVDGTQAAPGISWASEISTGFYRAGGNDMRATVAGVPRMRWTGAGVDIWDTLTSSWIALVSASGSNLARLNAPNQFTGNPQVIVDPSGAWQVWNNATPDLAGRFALQGNNVEIGRYTLADGAWQSKILAGSTATNYNNDLQTFFRTDGTTRLARFAPTGTSFGSVDYSPAAASAYRVGATLEAPSGRVEIGAYVQDGGAFARNGLFVDALGGSQARVGIDWVFSTGVAEFEFRRAGVTRFVYDNNAVRLLSTPAGTHRVTWQADDGGSAFWNTTAGLTGYQWYLNSVLCATMTADRLSVGRGLGLDYMIAHGVASGAVVFRGDGSTSNRGLSLGMVSNAGAFTPLFQLGDFTPGIARFLAGLQVQFFNSANIFSAGLNVPVGNSSSGLQYVENGTQRGGVMYHNDATFRFGGIFVSTAAAPGTGGTPGQIWMQTDT